MIKRLFQNSLLPIFVIMGLMAVYTPIRPLKYILVGLMVLEGLSLIVIDGAKLLKMIKH
ncbi:hypothetical protein NNC79_02055 [Streptococcus mutans]|uniref:hypothetical protein n=1 Tax=Streptococcus mutans TaxID=1309 RepID=UPI0028E97359|nr:hypothetical protein [Streptococcus mutans]MDT9562097.1 hypothetical protein [Streptococcus mutans]MDT9565791.1 hypothetical protein [Streptococcus mutans]